MVVVYTVRMDELSVGLHLLLVPCGPTFAYTLGVHAINRWQNHKVDGRFWIS